MMRRALVTAAIALGLLVPGTAGAHPGRTDGMGGHVCRTNCAKWGEVEGAWHSHSETKVKSKTPEKKAVTKKAKTKAKRKAK